MVTNFSEHLLENSLYFNLTYIHTYICIYIFSTDYMSTIEPDTWGAKMNKISVLHGI